MRVIVCRHGKPEGTEYGRRYLGLTDESLSEEGRKQAEELGGHLVELIAGAPVRIVSSPLLRALETALVIKEHLGCEFIETDRELAEINMGEWDGKSFSEVMEEYPQEYEARGRDLWNYQVSGGESFAEAGARFVKEIREITGCAHPEEVIVVVSHRGVMLAGLSLMTDIPFEEWMNSKINYAGAVILDVTGGRTMVEREIK